MRCARAALPQDRLYDPPIHVCHLGAQQPGEGRRFINEPPLRQHYALGNVRPLGYQYRLRPFFRQVSMGGAAVAVIAAVKIFYQRPSSRVSK